MSSCVACNGALLLLSSKHCVINYFLFSVFCDMRNNKAFSSADDELIEFSSTLNLVG